MAKNILELLKPVFDYVNTTIWKDETSEKEICEIANFFCENLKNITKEKIFQRFSGQSGSGKTTQLGMSILSVLSKKEIKPLTLAVRTFSESHPHYYDLLKKYGKANIREKTNGFALKCLCAVLFLAINKGYYIVLDLTILSPVIEKFLADLLVLNNYMVNFHLLAVNKKISNNFIEKRKNTIIGAEAGRVTPKNSADYFYEILPKGLRFLIKNNYYFSCYMWNAFDKKPCYNGKLAHCYEFFLKNRKKIKKFKYSEEELREEKIKFYELMLLKT